MAIEWKVTTSLKGMHTVSGSSIGTKIDDIEVRLYVGNDNPLTEEHFIAAWGLPTRGLEIKDTIHFASIHEMAIPIEAIHNFINAIESTKNSYKKEDSNDD